MATAKLDMDKLDSLCRRRGFIFPVERDLRRDQRVLGLRPARASS